MDETTYPIKLFVLFKYITMQQLEQSQIQENVLTGSRLNTWLWFYDETKNYSINDQIKWGMKEYQCISPVTGWVEWDLSNAPDISSDWDVYYNTKEFLVEVAKNWAEFSVIQDAIDSITVWIWEKYIVYVNPGTYEENVVLKTGVNILWVSSWSGVTITSTSWITLDFGDSFSHIENMKIQSKSTTPTSIISASGGLHVLTKIKVYWEINGTYCKLIRATDAAMYFRNGCNIDFDGTWESWGTVDAIELNGSSTLYLESTNVNMKHSGVGGTTRMTVIDDNRWANSSKVSMSGCNVYMSLTGTTPAWRCHFMESNTEQDLTEIFWNSVKILAELSTWHAGIFELSSATNWHINSKSNDYEIRWFDTIEFTNVSAWDVIDSRFDSLHLEWIDRVSDAIFWAGRTSYVTSPWEWNIELSGVIVPNTVDVTSDYDASEDWVFNEAYAVSSSLITFTFPPPSWMADFPNGSRRMIFNNGTGLVNVNPNGNNIDGNSQMRQIIPWGYAKFWKIDNEIRVLWSHWYGTVVEPDDLTHLEIWADFSDDSTLTKTGNAIDSIESKDPSSRVATYLNTQPIVTTNELNWHQTADFGSSSNNCGMSFGDISIHNNTRWLHIFALVEANTSWDIIMAKYASNTEREWYMQTTRNRTYELITGWTNAWSSYTPTYWEYSLIEFFRDPWVAVRIYINWHLISSDTTSVNTVMWDSASNLMIGFYQNNASELFWKVAEIVAYSDVKNTVDRTNIVNYFSAKYDLNLAPPTQAGYFDRDVSTSTISPITDNDNLDLGTGKISIWDVEVWGLAWYDWTFTNWDGNTVTVTKWIITSIV